MASPSWRDPQLVKSIYHLLMTATFCQSVAFFDAIYLHYRWTLNVFFDYALSCFKKVLSIDDPWSTCCCHQRRCLRYINWWSYFNNRIFLPGANSDDDARVDIAARGFWQRYEKECLWEKEATIQVVEVDRSSSALLVDPEERSKMFYSLSWLRSLLTRRIVLNAWWWSTIAIPLRRARVVCVRSSWRTVPI